MKLWRGQRPSVDEQAVGIVAETYLTFVDGLALCRRLTEQRFTGTPVGDVRGDALAGARSVAFACRAVLSAITEQELLARLSPELSPSRVLPALARIGYTLVALAEDAPEPEALLTRSELEDLGTQFGIEGWLARCRQLSGEATAEDEEGR